MDIYCEFNCNVCHFPNSVLVRSLRWVFQCRLVDELDCWERSAGISIGDGARPAIRVVLYQADLRVAPVILRSLKAQTTSIAGWHRLALFARAH